MQILIADDDVVSRRRVEAMLRKWGFETALAGDGLEAMRILQRENPPSLAILDRMMPGMDGVQVCQQVRKLHDGVYTYLLLLTAMDQTDNIVEGLEAGADEYLCKPFDPSELRARVRAGCRIVELQERLMAACEAQRVQATHDALTGLWNRAAVLDILQRELARSGRDGSPVSVALGDVDHFKQINDTHGHLAGDAVLREVSKRMQSILRTYDGLGRYGGEEFLMVIPGSELDGAHALAERVRTSISGQPIAASECLASVTMSLGVAANTGLCEAEALIHAADEALYRAKNGGRNRVELAPQMRDVCP